jgi:citrate synthase
MYGSLPSTSQFKVFQEEVLHHSVVHSEAANFFRSFRSVCFSGQETGRLTSLTDTMPIQWLSSLVPFPIWGHTTAKPIHLSKVPTPLTLPITALNFLQGQTLFTKGDAASLANMDKQIYRLIGKATTLAA